jgi:PAS domain S-box-containing protein
VDTSPGEQTNEQPTVPYRPSAAEHTLANDALGALTEALRQAEVGVALIGADLRFVLVNDVTAEINGPSAAEHIGAHIDDVLPDTSAAVTPLLRYVLDTGKPVLVEDIVGDTLARPGVVRTWTGDYLPYRLHGEADGPVDAVLIVFVEVTEERRAERRLRQVIDGLFTFVGLCDVDGTLLEANEFAVTAAGVDIADVVDRPFWDCYWWAYDAGVQRQLRDAVAAAAAGNVQRYDTYIRVAGGRLIPIDFQLVPVIENGTVVSLVPSGIDIESRSQQLEALSQLTTLAADLHLALGLHELVELIVDRSTGIFDTTVVTLAIVDPDDGSMQLTSPRHLDDTIAQRWTTLDAAAPLTPFHHVIEHRRPVWLFDQASRRERYPDMADDSDRAGLVTTASLPLVDSSGVIGVLGLGWAQSITDDPAMRLQAALFADICSQAIHRVHRTRSTVDLVSMLTDELMARRDQAHDLDVAVGYVPAGSALGFGGDWYDVVTVSESVTALIVGDVVGHDVEAAARMAVARSTLRTAVLARPALVGVGDLLTRSLGLHDPEFFATAVIVIIDTERRELRWKSFGHVPPIVVEPDGSAFVMSANGPPIGLLADRAPITTRPLSSGSTVLLYTDGLIETRSDPVDDRIALLSATVSATVGAPADVVLAEVMARMIGTGDNDDDVAIIAVTVP